MNRKILVTASLATLLATGALAQTTTPAPAPAPAPQAAPAMPATPPAATALHGDLTTGKIVGISIYAPREDARAAAPAAPVADPATTGSTVPSAITVSVVSDEQWRAMRDRHESIGKVDDLVIGQDGRISQAIVGVGGFLGIGEKKVALQLSEVRLMRSEDGTLFGVVMRTKQQLQDMPEFTASRS